MVNRRQMNIATTKPIVLAVLRQGENYGYQIIKKVLDLSKDEIRWSEPMLYPFLRRMEKEGLIKSKWRVVEGKRFRRYYRITEKGLAELEAERERWFAVHAVFLRLLEETR